MLLSRLENYPIDKIERHGELKDWVNAANMLFAPGCEAQACALLMSFGSPLISLFRTKEGGVLFSAYGAARAGKTVALCAAGSVWAKPITLNFDDRHQEDRFSFLTTVGNLPALHTRYLNHDPATTYRFLKNVFVLDYAKQNFWRGAIMSFTGASLFTELDALKRSFPRFGVEFKIAVPKGAKLSGLEYAFNSNSGNAAVPYLHYLAKPEVRKWARQALVGHFARLKEEFNLFAPELDQASRFQRRALAAIHVAGLITTKIDLLDFDVERISQWAALQSLPQIQAQRPELPLPPQSQESQSADRSCPNVSSEDGSNPPSPESKTPKPPPPAAST